MGKGPLIAILALLTGLVLAGGVWAQRDSAPGAFRGTITKVDWADKQIVVQNNEGEMTFLWNTETQVNGFPVEKVGLESKTLKEGMNVIVLYREGDQSRVANRIDVKTSNLKTLKGLSFPFECGVKVC